MVFGIWSQEGLHVERWACNAIVRMAVLVHFVQEQGCNALVLVGILYGNRSSVIKIVCCGFGCFSWSIAGGKGIQSLRRWLNNHQIRRYGLAVRGLVQWLVLHLTYAGRRPKLYKISCVFIQWASIRERWVTNMWNPPHFSLAVRKHSNFVGCVLINEKQYSGHPIYIRGLRNRRRQLSGHQELWMSSKGLSGESRKQVCLVLDLVKFVGTRASLTHFLIREENFEKSMDFLHYQMSGWQSALWTWSKNESCWNGNIT